MESLYLLIPLALVIVVIALKLLFWAINNGQYDDLDTEAQRILFDDELKPEPYTINNVINKAAKEVKKEVEKDK
jgi:cbb3-type cytochrome oxidase maturation protein